MNRLLKQAFTLIELLVVIAIIGILSGLIVVAMSGTTQKATIAKAQVFSNSLRNSLMLNLVAEYKLDEASGASAADSWGAHTAGTISGAVTYSSCPQNSCYSFDGADDYIQLPDASDLRMTTGGTISIWVYPETLGESAQRIIDKSTDTDGTNGYAFYIVSDNSIGFKLNNSSQTSTSSGVVAFNQWWLITFTFNSSGRKIYINGVDRTSINGNLTSLPPDVAGVVAIGNRASNTDRTFDGYIDQIRIYNTIIPVSQIKEQYYSGLNSLLASGGVTPDEYKERMVEIAKQ